MTSISKLAMVTSCIKSKCFCNLILNISSHYISATIFLYIFWGRCLKRILRRHDIDTLLSIFLIYLLGEMLKRILRKHNIDTCFQSMRPFGSFLISGRDLTRGDLVSGVHKIPCSCGKFYIGRTHQQFI